MSFDILTSVTSSRFLIFFIRGYQGLPTQVTSPLTLEFFYWLSPSHDLGHGFGGLI